jgi:propionyl-CoA carboxylase alpha chain
MTIHTLLIANRGQIARRVIRTAREMGLRTVAVFAEEDRLAPHVEAADVAVPLGDGTIAEAYRNRRAVLDAAAWQGADAIHPGYGYLTASGSFAKSVIEAGLVWLGPSPEVARLIGDDLALRQRAAIAEVATVDAVLLPGDDPHHWAQAVEPLGYPLIVAGPHEVDGRERRTVNAAGDLRAAVESTRDDLRAAGADGPVLAERVAPGAAIVEIPVLADGAGTVVTLGELERTTVRRRTVIAATPAPSLDPTQRETLARAAERLTIATGFRGVATVVASVRHDEIWVLDLVPALSRSHAATEIAFGVDLVRVQLELAAGGSLPMTAVRARGVARTVHLRSRGTGSLHDWRHGTTPGIRHDDAVTPGATVTESHDPVLTSLTARAATAAEAVARLGRGLRELHIHGVDADRDELIDLLEGDERPGDEPPGDDPGRYEREWQHFNAVVGPHLAAATLASSARHATASRIWPFVPTGWRNVGGSVREMRPGERTWRVTPTHSGFASQTLAFERRGERWDVSYHRVQRDHPLALRRRTDPVPTPSDLFNVTIGGPSGHATTTIVEVIRLDHEVTLVHFGRRAHRCTVQVVGDRYYVNSALGQSELRELARYPT